jgi:hypothetical protein
MVAMENVFACNPLSNTPLALAQNRQRTFARFLDGNDGISGHQFILDTDAIISTISKDNTIEYGSYDKNLMNLKATVGGFNKQPMFGRVISVKHLYIEILGIRDTLFFIPDSDDEIA